MSKRLIHNAISVFSPCMLYVERHKLLHKKRSLCSYATFEILHLAVYIKEFKTWTDCQKYLTNSLRGQENEWITGSEVCQNAFLGDDIISAHGSEWLDYFVHSGRQQNMHKNVMYLGQIRENRVHQSRVQENSCQKSFFIVLVLYVEHVTTFMVRFGIRH